MATFRDETLLSVNGKTQLHLRRCIPDTEPRAIVQLAHGIAEHINRYDGFALFLADAGFLVVGNDHLGHGQSITDPSELGYFGENGGWELAVGDMHQIYEQTREEYPHLPYFLFGHSMGSFLSRTYIIRYPQDLTGAILCGTGQQSPLLVQGGRMMAELEVKRHGAKYRSKLLNDLAFGKYNDNFQPKRTVCDWLSRDEAVVDAYEADPLCGYLPTAGLFRDMMNGLTFIGSKRNIERMKRDLPVLFIAGDKDPVGENGKGVLRVYQAFLKAGMTDVTMKLYHDCRHELLNELNKDEVMGDVLAWLESKMA